MAITRRHEMSQQLILFYEVFDVWGIDFMGPFPVSNVKAIATKTNDTKVVVDFLKSNIFYQFSVPKELISTKVVTSTIESCPPYSTTYWAIKQCNLAYDQAGQQRKFQLQELDELCLEAYENSRIYKQKVKQFHDQQILRKEFRVGQKVLLFNSRLNLIASKLHSRWDGPFVITNVFSYDVVELKDEHTNSTFRVNGHQIKLFHEGPIPTAGNLETISLMEPDPLDGAR
ncbi:hypothetical protein CR513_36789, partial [Mucuna pruriens]